MFLDYCALGKHIQYMCMSMCVCSKCMHVYVYQRTIQGFEKKEFQITLTY